MHDLKSFPELQEAVDAACKAMQANCGKFRWGVAPEMPLGGYHIPLDDTIVLGKDAMDPHHAPHIVKHEIAHPAMEHFVNEREMAVLTSLSEGTFAHIREEKRNATPEAPTRRAFHRVKETAVDIYAGLFMSEEEILAFKEYSLSLASPSYPDALEEAIKACRAKLPRKMQAKECALEHAIAIVDELCGEK
jgi:hypothetical protein